MPCGSAALLLVALAAVGATATVGAAPTVGEIDTVGTRDSAAVMDTVRSVDATRPFGLVDTVDKLGTVVTVGSVEKVGTVEIVGAHSVNTKLVVDKEAVDTAVEFVDKAPLDNTVKTVKRAGAVGTVGTLDWAGPPRECARCPRCPPPPARCKYEDSPGLNDEHFYTVDGVSLVLSFSDAYLKLPCPAGVTLDSASLPVLQRLSRLPRVILEQCPPPAGAGSVGYARALARLNVTVGASLELQHVPSAPPLEAHHLAELAQLQSLTIYAESEQILKIPESLFSPLTRLERLYLTGVQLEPALSRLPRSLVSLSVTRAGLAAMPAAALQRLPALGSLVLQEPALLQPPPLAAAPALRSLQIVAPLAALPSLDNLHNVTLGNVSNVTLVGSLSSLRRLVVSAPVMSLPAHWLAGAARLEELHLSGRHLASLPADALRGAYSLRDVTITRTVLRALPPDLLHDNTGLRRLALTHSSLQALPEGIFAGLSELQELDLSHNKLHPAMAVLRELQSVTSLQRLTLDHNPLGDACGRDDDTGTFDELSPLWQLLSLQELSYTRTGASRICIDWRRDLHNLASIDFSYNNLTILKYTDMLWGGSNRSVSVDLRGNPVRDVNIKAEQYNSLLRAAVRSTQVTLHLDAALVCSCHTYWAARALRELHLPVALRGATCDSTDLRAVRLDDLTCPAPAACPSGCTCLERPHRSALELRCASPPPPAALATLPPAPPHVHLLLAPAILRTLPRDLPARVTRLDLRNSTLPQGAARTTVAALWGDERVVLLAGARVSCECGDPLREAVERVGAAHDALCREGGRVSEAAPCEDAGVAGAAVALAAGAALLLVTCAVAWRCGARLRMKALLLARGLCPALLHDDEDDDCTYDVFIAFSHVDFAVAEEIVHELESGPRPLRVCVYYRDWRAGEFFTIQIDRSVQRSRRTLVLVSDHFARSAWCRAELQVAATRALRDVTPRLLVVHLPRDVTLDADLQALLRGHRALRWGHSAFWDQLRLALPPRTRPPPPRPRSYECAAPARVETLQRDAFNELPDLMREGIVVKAK